MKKLDKTSENKEISKNWFASLWQSNQKIAEIAKNYNEQKWYKSYRFIAGFLLLLQLGAGFAVGLLDIPSLIATATVFLPLVYLVMRGYRPFLIIAIIYYTIDKVMTIYAIDRVTLGALVWWVLTTLALLNAYRVEHVRAKTNKISGKRVIVDTLLAIIMVITCLVGFIFVMPKTDDGKVEQLVYWKAFSLQNTDWVKQHCSQYEIDMSKYSKIFNDVYSTQIEFIDNQLGAAGVDAQKLNSEMMASPEVGSEMLASFDAMRKNMIAQLVLSQSGGSMETFVWEDKYNEVLSEREFCLIMNENPLLMDNLDSDFNKFSVIGKK